MSDPGTLMSLRSPRSRLPLLALTLSACADLTALDLSLVADPNVTDTAALVSQLRWLKIVLDSPAGLYASPPSAIDRGLSLEDVDGDGQLELVAEHPVDGLGRLPRIRLEQGGLQPLALDLRLDGADAKPGEKPRDELVYFAAGGVRGVRFASGTVREVEVPFNRRLLYRQPQVTQVNPEDGAEVDPRSFGSVVLIFSKKMNPDSLRANDVLRLLQVEPAPARPIAAELITVTNLGGLESPAAAEYRFASILTPGTYRIEVSTAARDASGRPLDQVPMQPGDQPFSSSFVVGNTAVPTIECTPVCNDWCASGGDKCAPGLVCNKASRICEPRYQSCPGHCRATTVCDPARGICVPDCRVHGSYGGCPDGETCLPDGVCGR